MAQRLAGAAGGHILVKVTPSDADVDRAFELAKKVREQAAKGGDYAALVKRYSTYPGQAGPDGDVGFLGLGQMQPNIREGLQKLQPGAVREVLTNAQGLNIFKVVHPKPQREFGLDRVKDQQPEAAAQAQK